MSRKEPCCHKFKHRCVKEIETLCCLCLRNVVRSSLLFFSVRLPCHVLAAIGAREHWTRATFSRQSFGRKEARLLHVISGRRAERQVEIWSTLDHFHACFSCLFNSKSTQPQKVETDENILYTNWAKNPHQTPLLLDVLGS